MPQLRLTQTIIKTDVAETEVIFNRGESLFLLGNYTLIDIDEESEFYRYTFDGNYGEYRVTVSLQDAGASRAGGTKTAEENGGKSRTTARTAPVSATCTCPFPRNGCKHVVAACLDIERRLSRAKGVAETTTRNEILSAEYMTPEEIREAALEARRERASREGFTLRLGETYKGAHSVVTPAGKSYTVTFYDPVGGIGHCTCPDFATNHLETCKHLLFAHRELLQRKDLEDRAREETFPFVHIIWNARQQKPACYYERVEDEELRAELAELFNEKGIYPRKSISRLYKLFLKIGDGDAVLFDESLLRHMERILYEREVDKLRRKHKIDTTSLKASLYPYQREGVEFAVFKRSAIIADEMGLGKTVQAIAAVIMKKRIFGFSKVLVVCPSSVKEQWRREIEKFSDETALVVTGARQQRKAQYMEENAFFKIANYEAVMRDILPIKRWAPEIIILDEAQRIKNFETKTHQALSALPREHVLVLTGTPLENKLEDLYSIVQFCDSDLLTPLWAFAANHLNLDQRSKVQGYRNLTVVRDKLKGLILRRRRKDVIDSLPEQVQHEYYLPLTEEQEQIHQGYMTALLALINKKVITPIDMKRIQMTLLCARMVCDSTYLIDKETNISPKLVELMSILNEIVVENGRKVIIFSEWTTMIYLIGKALSDMEICFVEFTGKIPTAKRQRLVEEFHENDDCMVFLSSDAGGVGLNLQNADCIINFELPWNPAKLNQRIGRVSRIGQKSAKIDVINLLTRNSIEERVYATIGLKQELFDAVLEGEGEDEVDFSRESKSKFINQLREMFGEEPVDVRSTSLPGPELDEDTPHYLNPKALAEQADIDLGAEEYGDEEIAVQEVDGPAGATGRTSDGRSEASPDQARSVDPVQLETVLNQGLSFLDSIARMATGKGLSGSDDSDDKRIEIDRETGEVTLKFKLPGF